MTQAKFISSEPKSGMSAEEMKNLDAKIEALLNRANELNSDSLEIKVEMALKNKYISPQQEKELFELANDSDTLFTRYNKGERTEDLLAGMESHCQTLEQKRNEIFPDAPQDARLKLAEKKEGGVDDKDEIASVKKETMKAEKETLAEPQKQKEELIGKLDAAYKELYGFLNDKKVAPKEVYDLIRQTENELRGLVRFRGEVANIAEEIKEKYKKDERSEEEKAKKGKKIGQESNDGAEKEPGKKSGYTKEMVEARAGEIKQRRIEGQLGFEWEKIDALLRENKIEPGTPEADKFMTEWDKKIAGQKLIKEEKEKKAAEAVTQPTPEPEEKKEEEKKDYLRITPKNSGKIKKEEVEKPTADLGVAEKSPIELTEVVEEPKREIKESEVEVALTKAREEYVAALSENSKRKEGASRLEIIRDKFVHYFQGNKEEEYKRKKEEKIGGVMAEKAEAEEKFLKARENLKTSIKAYRDEKVGKIGEKTAELKAAGKSDEEIKSEMEKTAEEILLATTLHEAAKMEDLKAQKQIEQMGKWRRNINDSTERFSNWYKGLPLKYKFAVSGALFVAGGGLGFVGIGSTVAVMSAAFAGQAALRVLGGSMTTAGLERLLRNIEEKEEGKSLNKEFGGKFLETLKNENDKLDERLFKMVKSQQTRKNLRFAVAGLVGGVVGTGILATAVREAFGWTGGGKIKTGAGVGADSSGPKGPGAPGVEASVDAGVAGKVAREIISLPIGDRGPEGAIIDHLQKNPDMAEKLAAKMKISLSGKEDIGKLAHRLWLASVEGELAKTGMKEKLIDLDFTADKEGYAKAMDKIGKGFVELDPAGNVSLSDNTSFLRAGAVNIPEISGIENVPSAIEAPVSPEAPSPAEAPKPEVTLTPEELEHEKIKQTVTRLVEPSILTDKTFKAAAKITLGKILDEVPPGVYKDKYALSQYWHSLSGLGVETPDLPGTGFLGDLSYDDFRKYAEMTKFLQENPVLKSAAGLKNMTVEEFFKIYGGDLNKVIKK